MIDYNEMKRRVSALDAAKRYGLEFDKTGKRAKCIWHPDTHPSLSFKGSFCHCFSCGNGGSCLDVVKRVFSCDLYSAAKLINQDFNLGMSTTPANPPYNAETGKACVRAALLKHKIKVLEKYLRENGPKHADEPMSDAFIYCANKLTECQLELEELNAKYNII